MQTKTKQRIVQHALIIAGIILITSLLRYYIGMNPMVLPRFIRTINYYAFPIEILEFLRIIMSIKFHSWHNYHLYNLPLFSICYAIFLFIAINNFKKTNKSNVLRVALYMLIILIAISVPYTINGYLAWVKEYNRYEGIESGGILDLLDKPKKPSPIPLIIQLLLMLFYIMWSVYLLKLINKLKANG